MPGLAKAREPNAIEWTDAPTLKLRLPA